MKIICIFADQLFAFHYDNNEDNEYDRLMELWTDVGFLNEYAKINNIEDVNEFIIEILHDAEQIQDFLENLNQNNQSYGIYFEPLQESERKKQLPFQKGKIKWNRLRLYAIKLEENFYVITGGAIKMSQTMQEHPDTQHELTKLNAARAYFERNWVFDADSFYELLIEQQ